MKKLSLEKLQATVEIIKVHKMSKKTLRAGTRPLMREVYHLLIVSAVSSKRGIMRLIL